MPALDIKGVSVGAIFSEKMTKNCHFLLVIVIFLIITSAYYYAAQTISSLSSSVFVEVLFFHQLLVVTPFAYLLHYATWLGIVH